MALSAGFVIRPAGKNCFSCSTFSTAPFVFQENDRVEVT